MYRSVTTVSLILLLAGCGNEAASPQPPASDQAIAAPVRTQDFARVTQGGKIYQANCASCHGRQGEGAPDWQQRDAHGFFPAPPLNGTGHAWHHPRRMLEHVVRNGSPGGGRMPAWGDRLSSEEIAAVIDWFQSRWPDEVYAAWEQNDRRARQTARGPGRDFGG